MSEPRLHSVNAGRARPVPWGSVGRSAIDKRRVEGPVRVHRLGVDGDEQADRRHHGGTEQAVYAYARADLDLWAAELLRDLNDGVFGENLTTEQLDLSAARVGERWRIGSVLLEVTTPRIPCRVFQGWLDEPQWVKRFTAYGRPGTYLRVVEEGVLQVGDPIDVVHVPGHHVTVGHAFRALTTERHLLPAIAAVPGMHAHLVAAAEGR